MRLKPYAILCVAASLTVSGCSTGRTASRSAIQAGHPEESYQHHHAPQQRSAPREPLSVPPVPPAVGVSQVKRVSLTSFWWTRPNAAPCVTEPCVTEQCTKATCVVADGCAAPQQCCVPAPAVTCGEAPACHSWSPKSLFKSWKWPGCRDSCAQEPVGCTTGTVCPAPTAPCCTAEHGCAAPTGCPCPVSKDVCAEEGCCQPSRSCGLIPYLHTKFFGPPVCQNHSSCGDYCPQQKGCTDGCGNQAKALVPKCTVDRRHPIHNGSPLAGQMEDPFAGKQSPIHDAPAVPEKPQQAAPALDLTPATPAPAPGIGQPQPVPNVPEQQLQPAPKPLDPVPQATDSQTWVEPQIWPRLKAEPVWKPVPPQSAHLATWPATR